MNYERRIVAFIDILGFKELLNNSVSKNGDDIPEKIDDIASAYESIRDIWDLDLKSETLDTSSSESKKVTIFSDSVVISFKAEEPSEVFYTLVEIKWMIMRLLWRGILCRGAVSLGKFIHTDKYLFGPALAEAYLLETKAALYPRIILDRNIIEIGAQFSNLYQTDIKEKDYIELLEIDSDGMYYIDYFFKAQSELDDPMYDFPDYIINLGDIIRKGLMASSHSTKADLRIKYSWMRERYNNMVDIVQNKHGIEVLRKRGESELAEFYIGLKQISPRKNITSKSSGRLKRRR